MRDALPWAFRGVMNLMTSTKEDWAMTARRLFDFPGLGWRSPFAELERMQREMDRLVGRPSWGTGGPGLPAGVFPSVNVTEDKDHYFVRAELPGVRNQVSASRPPLSSRLFDFGAKRSGVGRYLPSDQ